MFFLGVEFCVTTHPATSFVGWDAATGLETTWTGLIFPGGIGVDG